ncbi:MAG: diacylglycerol kinase family lipid kinase [Anaerolineales bacterium]|nr:MAG: diacylglycerol kinase family lipid kinase [Anaerolineales bacterium]
MKRYKIIVNPVSGRGAGERSIPVIKHHLENLQLDFDLVISERPGHAIELALQASKEMYHAVVAVGGDGTANEVINGLAMSKITQTTASALGVLAVGRGNDFAYGMTIPHSLQLGCEILANDNRRPIDIGKITGGDYPEGRYFGNGVGIGFDAVVGFEAAKMKRIQGFLSYLVAALRTILLYYKAPTILIEIDDQSTQLDALMVSIMNGQRMGGVFMMAPQALPDDGNLTVCIARQVSRPTILRLIPSFMSGTQNIHTSVNSTEARTIKVSALQGTLPAHADGETICEQGTQLMIEIFPRYLEIISDLK